jgi:radical SAM protein with 4Fe4S-binding SPASM domain
VSRSAIRKLRTIITKLKEPRRVANYFGTQIGYLLKLSKVPFTPPRIDLEPNNTCNLRCRHCQVTYWSKPAVHLDMPAFKRVLGQFPGLLSIKLQGMGEPLLNRELVAMLREGERRGISMEFFTNGTVLSHEHKAQLLALNRTRIVISVDGATAETFESIRVGSSFEKVIGNVRELMESRGNRRYPEVSLSTVITGRNLHEVPAIVKLAGQLKVDYLSLQTSLTDWGKEEINEYNKSIRVRLESGVMTDILNEARRVAAEFNVDLRIYTQDYYSRKNKCTWPWKRVFIAANGDVVPCCIIADADTMKMGNVFEQSFAEIWNSPKYRELRRRIKNHELYEFCKKCYID